MRTKKEMREFRQELQKQHTEEHGQTIPEEYQSMFIADIWDTLVDIRDILAKGLNVNVRNE